MKRAFSLLALCCALALAAAAAGIDGKWIAKIERKAPKKKGGQATSVEFTLDLKSQDGQLTGTVMNAKGRRGMTIENGKLAGDKFSFTTVQKTRKAEQKWVWEGTVAGDELRGTRSQEGKRRETPFTAKRS